MRPIRILLRAGIVLAVVLLVFTICTLFYLDIFDTVAIHAHSQLKLQSWRQAWRHWWQGMAKNGQLYRGTLDCPLTTNATTLGDHGKLNASTVPTFDQHHTRMCTEPWKPAFGCGRATATDLRHCADRQTRLGPYGYADKGIYSQWPIQDLAAYQNASIDSSRQTRSSVESPFSTPRTAVVLRAWDSFQWTGDDLFNVRAMVSELSVSSGTEYELFVLLHVKNVTDSHVVADLVPPELVGLTELWTYAGTEAAYPRVGSYDVYNHTFMSLQLFAKRHPNFDYFWNWEMDVRYTGNYGNLFSSIEEWADSHSSTEPDGVNHRFYIPAYHNGSCEQFEARHTRSDHTLRGNTTGFEPSTGSWTQGRLSSAHLVTLFPIFNVSGTLWPHKDNVIDHSIDPQTSSEPRYGTVGTNMRLSFELLDIMHEENLAGRAMMSEMWPPTLAARNGLKSVYVPHPVFMEHEWTPEELERTFNAGMGGHVGGSIETVINQEDNFIGSTWFWNQPFALKLYSSWLGRSASGPGSAKWEQEHGPMCLPPILLHPVKTDQLFGTR